MSTLPTQAFARHLAERIGAKAQSPPDVISRVHAAYPPERIAAVLAPDSADAIAAALAECTAEQWPVVAIGAGTWLPPLGPGPKPPVLISTARLTRVSEHEPADLVIGVQAGLTLHRLNAVLAAQGQWLPLDPAVSTAATIGAIAAQASAGPLRAAHGTPRDMALGIEMATGDGRLIRFGGRVVKNVAGYDGVRLAVGSMGTLGIITGIYLRVRGAPRADRTVAIDCGSGRDGMRRGAELALAIRDAATCDALELLSPGTASHAAGGQRGWTLLVRVLGGEAAVAESIERVQVAAGGSAVPVADSVWSDLAVMEAGAAGSMRLTGPATSLANGLVVAQDAIGDATAEATMIAAHAADGVVRVWTAAARELRTPNVNNGWTVRYDRTAARRPNVPGDGVAALTARIRSVFDPAGILGTEI